MVTEGQIDLDLPVVTSIGIMPRKKGYSGTAICLRSEEPVSALRPWEEHDMEGPGDRGGVPEYFVRHSSYSP